MLVPSGQARREFQCSRMALCTLFFGAALALGRVGDGSGVGNVGRTGAAVAKEEHDVFQLNAHEQDEIGTALQAQDASLAAEEQRADAARQSDHTRWLQLNQRSVALRLEKALHSHDDSNRLAPLLQEESAVQTAQAQLQKKMDEAANRARDVKARRQALATLIQESRVRGAWQHQKEQQEHQKEQQEQEQAQQQAARDQQQHLWLEEMNRLVQESAARQDQLEGQLQGLKQARDAEAAQAQAQAEAAQAQAQAEAVQAQAQREAQAEAQVESLMRQRDALEMESNRVQQRVDALRGQVLPPLVPGMESVTPLRPPPAMFLHRSAVSSSTPARSAAVVPQLPLQPLMPPPSSFQQDSAAVSAQAFAPWRL